MRIGPNPKSSSSILTNPELEVLIEAAHWNANESSLTCILALESFWCLGPIHTRNFLLENWPATLGCFCLSRTKLDNYHWVRTHCVGLTLLTCYPTFLLRKKELEQARQPYLFWVRKTIICVRKLVSCLDWCFNFVRERPALWCLSGSAETLSRLYRPSARGSTYDWQTDDNVCLFGPSADCPLPLRIFIILNLYIYIY